MISRLSACATLFAVLATSTLAFAASSTVARRAEVREMPVVQLPAVEIVVKRRSASAPVAATR
jgi:hypothetical protein